VDLDTVYFVLGGVGAAAVAIAVGGLFFLRRKK